jgi:hypothetical protein
LGSDGAHRISALTKSPFVSSIVAAVLGAAFASALTSTAAMSACQAKISDPISPTPQRASNATTNSKSVSA